MSGKVFMVLAALCLLSPSLAFVVPGNDSSPVVNIYEIGTDYVVFNVSGTDIFDNFPVKSINVNYTQISTGASLQKPSVIVQNHVINIKLGFDRLVNVTNLNAGASYQFQFYLSNTMNERGPGSLIDVLLKPQTPDFSITHRVANTIRLFWGYPDENSIDYFLLTVEKQSNPGCGFTLNFTRCYGNNYDLANIEQGQIYIFKFISHNQSGDSETVEVVFPYD